MLQIHFWGPSCGRVGYGNRRGAVFWEAIFPARQARKVLNIKICLREDISKVSCGKRLTGAYIGIIAGLELAGAKNVVVIGVVL